MKYQCDKCKKPFLFPADATEPIEEFTTVNPHDPTSSLVTAHTAFITKRCPYCKALEIIEFAEPVEEIANVYIYDLTTGPQTELDGLLAQGYRIVNRYSKQYHLEKPKEAKQP